MVLFISQLKKKAARSIRQASRRTLGANFRRAEICQGFPLRETPRLRPAKTGRNLDAPFEQQVSQPASSLSLSLSSILLYDSHPTANPPGPPSHNRFLISIPIVNCFRRDGCRQLQSCGWHVAACFHRVRFFFIFIFGMNLSLRHVPLGRWLCKRSSLTEG